MKIRTWTYLAAIIATAIIATAITGLPNRQTEQPTITIPPTTVSPSTTIG